MLKKTINYVDFDGKPRTEDFHFHLTKSEFLDWEAREHSRGGMVAQLEGAIERQDGGELMDLFRSIIAKAYGEKSEDGRFFRKSPERSQDFLNSAAYDTLFMEIMQNPDMAADFIKAIVPADIAQAAENQTRPVPQDRLPKQQAPSRNVFEQVEDVPEELRVTDRSENDTNEDLTRKSAELEEFRKWREQQAQQLEGE